MKKRFRYDADLDAVVEIGGNFFEETPLGPSVIGDGMGDSIEGLRAMYRKDKKHFDSKSRYRADVKAHGLAEVGNLYESTRARRISQAEELLRGTGARCLRAVCRESQRHG